MEQCKYKQPTSLKSEGGHREHHFISVCLSPLYLQSLCIAIVKFKEHSLINHLKHWCAWFSVILDTLNCFLVIICSDRFYRLVACRMHHYVFLAIRFDLSTARWHGSVLMKPMCSGIVLIHLRAHRTFSWLYLAETVNTSSACSLDSGLTSILWGVGFGKEKKKCNSGNCLPMWVSKVHPSRNGWGQGCKTMLGMKEPHSGEWVHASLCVCTRSCAGVCARSLCMISSFTLTAHGCCEQQGRSLWSSHTLLTMSWCSVTSGRHPEASHSSYESCWQFKSAPS